MPLDESVADAWIIVRLPALAENVRVLKEALANGQSAPAKFMAVVKADAYGHGAARVAPALRDAGADSFGVTTLTEALEICRAGIDSHKTPVLVFAPLVGAEQIAAALAQGLHITVCDREQVEQVLTQAKKQKVQAALHLKVDTGMGRLGLSPEEAISVAHRLDSESGARWAGVYTHFARAGEKDLAPTREALRRFQAFCQRLSDEGVAVETYHCANSAAALRLPESRMDTVRIGTVLYGQYPSSFVPRVEGLVSETWRMQARVVWVHDLPAGSPVGYGAETTVSRRTRAVVLPVGTADGFAVSPNSLFRGARGLASLARGERPQVMLQGRTVPVLGRVAMQMIVVDVTDLPSPVRPGDIAEIPARRLSASARLPKIYETS